MGQTIIDFKADEILNQVNQDPELMTEFNLLKRLLTDKDCLSTHKPGQRKLHTFNEQAGAFVYFLERYTQEIDTCICEFVIEDILSKKALEAVNNHGNFVLQIKWFFGLLRDGIDTASRIDFLTKVIAAILMLLTLWIGTAKIFDEDMGGKENNSSTTLEQKESKQATKKENN